MTNEEAEAVNKELWVLTRQLTSRMIPYHPPSKNMRSLELNNPDGYKLLTRYLELNEIYTNWIKESFQCQSNSLTTVPKSDE